MVGASTPREPVGARLLVEELASGVHILGTQTVAGDCRRCVKAPLLPAVVAQAHEPAHEPQLLHGHAGHRPARRVDALREHLLCLIEKCHDSAQTARFVLGCFMRTRSVRILVTRASGRTATAGYSPPSSGQPARRQYFRPTRRRRASTSPARPASSSR